MRPLAFHFISKNGDSLFLAHRLVAEGHDVRLWIEHRPYRFCGRGLVPLASSIEPVRGATVIIDETGFHELGARLRRRGFAVIGGNAIEASETSRKAGESLFERAGLLVPETFHFSNVKAAQKMLASDGDGKWFFKPDDAPSYLTVSTYGGTVMSRYLDYAAPLLKKPTFALQRCVEGTEVDVDVWLSRGQRVGPNEVDLEEKKLLAGERGPRTGCQSNVTWDSDDEIVSRVIEPFYALVAERDPQHTGVYAVNTIVTASGDIYALEATARLGYDATQAFASRITDRLGEQLAEFAAGGLHEFETLPDRPYAMTLRLTVPPFPSNSDVECARVRGLPLPGDLLDDHDGVAFYPDNVMRRASGDLVCAGGYGAIGTLVAVGTSIPMLRRRLLDVAASIDIPNVQYRVDPVDSAEARLDALTQLGLVARKPMLQPPAFDTQDERSNVEAGRVKPSADDDGGSSTGTVPDTIAGGLDDLQEGSMTGGPSDDAAPASSDAGSVASP